MAKRFTCTEKWSKQSFTDLPLKMKVAWIYLLDRCDNAGIWDINIKLLSFQIGEEITLNELRQSFKNKIEVIGNKLIIKQFIAFQYGELNPNNNAHKSVIRKLDQLKKGKKKPGAGQGLARGWPGAHRRAQDKDMDMDMVMDKDKEEENYNDSVINCEDMYKKYPRKIGKTKGFTKLKQLAKDKEKIKLVERAIENYKDYCIKEKIEKKFIKYFSTFMEQWEDWVEPISETKEKEAYSF